MLLRVDPDKNFLALLSLPRDLRVEIPGYGTDKLNAAYSYGEQVDPKKGERGGPGVTLTKDLDIDVNHIVNVDFSGFQEAVNEIGCVYVDVDRHYYNPTAATTTTSTSRPATSSSAATSRSTTCATATPTTTSSAAPASRASSAKPVSRSRRRAAAAVRRR